MSVGRSPVIVTGTDDLLLVCAALAFDVGSWFHAQRQLQRASTRPPSLAPDLPLATGAS